MSYNIDTFKVKKLENLVIPMTAFFEHERKDWHPEIKSTADGGCVLECGCEQEIHGTVIDGNLHVSKLEMSGEGSGTFKGWILDEALSQSTGVLEAVLIWEGGDSVTSLKLNDGELIETDIEL